MYAHKKLFSVWIYVYPKVVTFWFSNNLCTTTFLNSYQFNVKPIPYFQDHKVQYQK